MTPVPTESGRITLGVVGAHLTGQPLNHQLTDRGATFLSTRRTAPAYRMYVLDTVPAKPGLVRGSAGEPGVGSVELEIWSLTAAGFGEFVDEIPSPLCIGRLVLDDGAEVAGFLCESYAVGSARDITGLGGWRAYLAL